MFLIAALPCVAAETSPSTAVRGTIDWENMTIDTTVTLDMAQTGMKLPGGRAEAEEVLLSGYIRLMRPVILALPVDSSRTMSDLVHERVIATTTIDRIALAAKSVPPVLSSNFSHLTASRIVNMAKITPEIVSESPPVDMWRPVQPVSAPAATGIVILADTALPVRGKHESSFALPCLFPKIWDSDMNLVYSREMRAYHNEGNDAEKTPFFMVKYATRDKILRRTPSGIDESLAATVGNNPVRIIAEGVFGIRPTDLVINRDDALVLVSTDAMRALLRDGKVAVILSENVLHTDVTKVGE